MVTIPRAEIDAFISRHSSTAVTFGNMEAEEVRRWAAELRDSGSPELLAEADDLDALVDRIERKAS